MMEDSVDAGWLLRPCVYLLLWKESVVYVGQSRKPLSRLYTHASAARGAKGPAWLRAKAVRFDGLRIVPCAAEALSELEARLIAEYRPRFNVALNPRPAMRGPRPKVPVALVIKGRTITLNSEAPRGAPTRIRRI